MKNFQPFLLSLVFAFAIAGGCDQTVSAQTVTLKQIDGRFWLLDGNGKPFFAHGITHVGTKRAKIDYAAFSTSCKRLGFNAYGYGCPPELRHDLPYLEGWNHLVPISLYRGKKGIQFVDIFDTDVQDRLSRGVEFYARKNGAHGKNLIGYCWTDLGAWSLKNPSGLNWVDYIKQLPEDAAGKKAYRAFLSKSTAKSAEAQDQQFLKLIAREYFGVLGKTQRAHAPKHLIFGDRFAFNTFDDDVAMEMLPWVDAIAIQPPFWAPFPHKELERIHRLTGKPILLCDFAIRFKEEGKDVKMRNIAGDSRDAAQQYEAYVKAALQTNYVIGIFWCNPVDTAKGFGNPGVKQGFFADGLASRPGLHETVRRLNEHIRSVTPKQVFSSP